MPEITAEQFEEITGLAPEQDDLERANCPEAGNPGHMQCGWNEERNWPNWMAWPPMQTRQREAEPVKQTATNDGRHEIQERQ